MSDIGSSRGDGAHTKQVLRLLDSIKVLGDENAELLKKVQEADEVRMEAKTARDQMRQFREDYGNRVQKIKRAFRKSQQENSTMDR